MYLYPIVRQQNIWTNKTHTKIQFILLLPYNLCIHSLLYYYNNKQNLLYTHRKMITISGLPNQYQSHSWRTKIHDIIHRNIKCCTRIHKNNHSNHILYIIGVQSTIYESIILRILWSFEIKEAYIVIHFKTMDTFANFQGTTGDDEKWGQKFQTYLSILNEKNKNIQGCFYTQQKNQFILCYSCKISINIIQNNISLSLFISNIYRLFSEEFNQFTSHFQLFNQPPSQMESQTNTQELRTYAQSKTPSAFTILNRMRILKEHFQNERSKRNKSTSCNLGFNKIKIINNLELVCALHCVDLKKFKLPEYMTKNEIKVMYEEIKLSEQAKYKKYKEVMLSSIVFPIDLKKIESEQYLQEGGFSVIKKGMYEYGICETIYGKRFKTNDPSQITFTQRQSSVELPFQFTQVVNRREFAYKKEKMKIEKKLLVKKEPKNKNDESFKNQLKALIFFRNQKERYMARYYLDINVFSRDEASQANQLFLDIYECNLKEIMKKWSKRKKIRILGQIIRGISFLQDHKILHRDLKEQNIMIDKQQNARIIDLGSCCSFFENDPRRDDFSVDYNRLRSTPGYYLAYQDVYGTSITSKYSEQEYERSPFFDVYSFGHIIQSMFKGQFAQCESIIDYQLQYISRKCKQANPEDRLSCEQIKLYLNLIAYLFLEECSIVKQKEKNKHR